MGSKAKNNFKCAFYNRKLHCIVFFGIRQIIRFGDGQIKNENLKLREITSDLHLL